MRIRPATPADYDAFVRLFALLEVDDPVPPPEVWSADLESVQVAEEENEVRGYVKVRHDDGDTHVFNVAVDPRSQRRGVGRALMLAAAEHARAAGSRVWRLNVKEGNGPALALYGSVGLRRQYRSIVLRLTWNTLAKLPRGGFEVHPVTPADVPALHERWVDPIGSLRARVTRAGVTAARHDRGYAWLNPAFPGGAIRCTDPAGVRPLLEALLPAAAHDWLQLVVMDDDGLAPLLEEAGAERRLEILHLSGPLPMA